MTRSGVPQVELRPGHTISRLIKGGWQLAGGHGDVDREAAIADMRAFVDAGVTTFDCADIYTGVEEMIGAFLVSLRAERGQEAVRAVRVHTKFVPDTASLAKLTGAHIEAIIDRSLQRLGVECLDLVQFHWWDYGVPGAMDALGHLDRLRQAGKLRHIGVTNFDCEHLAELLRSGIDIVSAQVQLSLLDRRPEGAFARLCREHDVAILAYGALAGGFLTEHWLGKADPGLEFENRSLVKYRLIIEEMGGWPIFRELLSALAEIARRRGASIANVALRAMLDHPDVTAVIIGARYARHLDANLSALPLELDDADRRLIGGIQARTLGPSGPVYGLERDENGPHGRILRKNLNNAAP